MTDSGGPTRARLALAALALAAVGCGGSSDWEDSGVRHLDPRLEDGSSTAARLAGGPLVWVEAQRFERVADAYGPWTIRYADVQPGESGGSLAIRGNVPDGRKLKRVELHYGGEIDSGKVDLLELELAHTTRGIARVRWRSSDSPPGGSEWLATADASVENSAEPAHFQVALADHPEWRGTIHALTVVPKEVGLQRYELHGVRLGRKGFVLGPDAHYDDRGSAVDAGLIARGRETRRAWPTDYDVPLLATVSVPEGGRFVADVSISNQTRDLTAQVHFAVDVREPGGGWVIAGRRSWVPGFRHEGMLWEPLVVDLSEHAGQVVELRLRSFRGPLRRDRVQGLGGELERARAFWGAPTVFGDMPEDRRPNVLLVTLDTLRADALGTYAPEGTRRSTPEIDRLAAGGVVFDSAWTAANATTPSHASLLTGLAVQDHGVLDNRMSLGRDCATLAETFAAAGWATAAAVSVEHLQTGRSGLGRGFDRFLLASPAAALDGRVTIEAVGEWLDEWQQEGQRPFFLWVHLFDPHTPYGPPERFLQEWTRERQSALPAREALPPTLPDIDHTRPDGFLAGVTNRAYADALYHASVSYTDRLVGDLLAHVRRAELGGHTAVCLTADHGEFLGEHDNWYHHTGLYEEVMRVPLVFAAPGWDRSRAGRRVAETAWSLDVAPTLLGLAGLEPLDGVRGRDLLNDPPGAGRQVWFEHSDLHQVGAVRPERYMITSLVDYVQLGEARRVPAGTVELYDRDGGRTLDTDRAPELPGEVEAWRGALEAWRRSARGLSSSRSALTPEQERDLQQLGY